MLDIHSVLEICLRKGVLQNYQVTSVLEDGSCWLVITLEEESYLKVISTYLHLLES